jgi:hypothetical protein
MIELALASVAALAFGVGIAVIAVRLGAFLP